MRDVFHTETLTLDGLSFRVQHIFDEFMREPWKEDCGHGEVSEWTDRAKRPGERVLASDRGSKRYYDFEGAVQTALRDGWDTSRRDRSIHMTARQIAAIAAEDDFNRLRAWCNDEWHWIGVAVTLLDTDGHPLPGEDARESLMGVESDADEYLGEVARELAETIAGRFAGQDTACFRIRNAQEAK